MKEGYGLARCGEIINEDWLFANDATGEYEQAKSTHLRRQVTLFEENRKVWWKPIKPKADYDNYEHPSVGDEVGTDWLHLSEGEWKPYKRLSPQVISEPQMVMNWLKPKSQFPLQIPGYELATKTITPWLTELGIVLIANGVTYRYRKVAKVCTECGREIEE